jgi:hypothetical protein
MDMKVIVPLDKTLYYGNIPIYFCDRNIRVSADE